MKTKVRGKDKPAVKKAVKTGGPSKGRTKPKVDENVCHDEAVVREELCCCEETCC